MIYIWSNADAGLIFDTAGKYIQAEGAEYDVVPLDYNLTTVETQDTVLAMGTNGYKRLQDAGLAPKNHSIAKLRGKRMQVEEDSPDFLITYDPGITKREAPKICEIRWDARLAARLELTGSLRPELGDYQWCEDLGPLILSIKDKWSNTNRPVRVCWDLETMGLYPWYPEKHIITSQWTDRIGKAYVLDHRNVSGCGTDLSPLIREQLEWLLRSEYVSTWGANLKFDIQWVMEKWGILCRNFTFDTVVAGSLLDENRSNSLNTHAKEYTRMGGYDDCVVPGTRVCTADLRWVPVEEVAPGDELVGFDEVSGYKQRKRLRVAVAESTKRLEKSCVEVHLSDGSSVVCTEDHGFMAHRYKSNGPFEWIRAKDLRPGSRIQKALEVEEPATSYEAGYLAGLYDGEGYVSYTGNGICSGLSQKPGPVWDRYTKAMEALGLGGFYASSRNGDGVMTSKHSGADTFHMLQKLRPIRLLEKRCYEGKCIPSGVPKVCVERVEVAGVREVVSLQTSTRTFLAEGLCSHNSFNETIDKGHMELVPPEELLPYAGGDVDAGIQCGLMIQKQLIQDPRLVLLYQHLIHPGLIAFERVERRGLLVDVEKYLALEKDLHKEIVAITRELMAMIPMQIKAKFSDNLKLSRAALLVDFLFDSPHGLKLKPTVFAGKQKYGPKHQKAGEPYPSTSIDDHLGSFRTHPKAGPFIKAMERLNSAKKTLQTYVATRADDGTIKKGFLAHLRPDNRFHATYALHTGALYDNEDTEGGTVTGRLSAKNPAVQTLPKHTAWAKKLRECYPAPPGMICWQLDFSQGELRVAACIANEKRMIQAYLDGIDLHAITAATVNKIPVEKMLAMKKANPSKFKELRQGGKAGNFGKIYGMMPPGFVDYAWKQYGVNLSLEDSIEFHETFFDLYPALIPWHTAAKDFARRFGHVRSPLGRIRHLPLIKSPDSETRAKSERQAINSTVQGTLSDLCVDAVAVVERWIEEHDAEDLGHTVGSTHDSLYGYVREDCAEQVVGQWQALINARSLGGENSYLCKTFGWKHQLPFPVDAELGDTMASLEEVKLAA